MREITVSGSSYEIGNQHGSAATDEIARGIEFYKDLFQRSAGLNWADACAEAEKFLPFLESQKELKEYVEEMRGIAAGSSQAFPSILAMNVRTELAYGFPARSTDGCTAISWKSASPSTSILAQNWDWQSEQTPNLIALTISQSSGKPTIKMITEAGLIGKIGMNSAGVGVCLNAIKAPGISYGKVPCHLALRMVLDSSSAQNAWTKLTTLGVASSCHMLVADSVVGGRGVECSARDIETIPINSKGQVFHSNHYVLQHAVESKLYLPDSVARLARIEELTREQEKKNSVQEPSVEIVERLLEDEQGFPTAICRERTEKSSVATLFSIVMDLGNKRARVRVGRPTESTERVELVF